MRECTSSTEESNKPVPHTTSSHVEEEINLASKSRHQFSYAEAMAKYWSSAENSNLPKQDIPFLKSLKDLCLNEHNILER